MINAIIGKPRSGKSFEAVVYHIIPALQKGRKVITNIPLQIEWFIQVYGRELFELIEVRAFDFAAYGKTRPFSTPEEYQDDWRNDKGQGPLYVIDEAHLSLPRGRTPVPVVEFYSMHGHYGVDILLLTQSYGKLDRDVIAMIQICYYTNKNTALGSENTYVKKVRDGVRGEVLNTEIRKYKSQYFAAYKSHTQSKDAIAEASAQDIKPIWHHWSIKGAALFLVIGIVLLGNVLLGDDKKAQPKAELVTEIDGAKLVFDQPEKPKDRPTFTGPKPEPEPEKPKEKPHPYQDIQLHVKAHISGLNRGKLKDLLYLVASQNGQATFDVTGADLVAAGYKYSVLNPCMVEWSYKGRDLGYLTCDVPTVGIMDSFAGR